MIIGIRHGTTQQQEEFAQNLSRLIGGTAFLTKRILSNEPLDRDPQELSEMDKVAIISHHLYHTTKHTQTPVIVTHADGPEMAGLIATRAEMTERTPFMITLIAEGLGQFLGQQANNCPAFDFPSGHNFVWTAEPKKHEWETLVIRLFTLKGELHALRTDDLELEA